MYTAGRAAMGQIPNRVASSLPGNCDGCALSKRGALDEQTPHSAKSGFGAEVGMTERHVRFVGRIVGQVAL